MLPLHQITFVILSTAGGISLAQSVSSCAPALTPTNSIRPSVASGYRAALVATGLTKPRSLQFDNSGNLLVVQAGSGITALHLDDKGDTCISVGSQKSVVQSAGLNHGLALSGDGRTLFASSPEAVYSWQYDPISQTVSQSNRTLVDNMNTDDHTTRTLLIPRKVNDTLLVSRGSTSNIDAAAEMLSSGHSQIRAFDLGNITNDAYDFDVGGLRLGWGLRNSVGVAEHPVTGGIFSVENSADQVSRDGQDIHENNPGEEMNFHGYLNGTKYAPQGSNYGYPYCFAAWVPGELPANRNLTVGSQFAIGTQNNTINDTYCAEQTPPRLTFQAHMAPLDIKFNDSGIEAWVTFHGSWDRTDPSGYKLSVIAFQDGQPTAASDSNTSYVDVFGNVDNSKCPNNCFRPAGIAIDNQGRLFMSSDATGEIYVILKDETSNGTFGGENKVASGTKSKTSEAGRLVGSSFLAVAAIAVGLLTIA